MAEKVKYLELIKKIAERTEHDVEDVKEIIRAFAEVVKEEVGKGNEVKIPKFGKFYKLRKKVVSKHWKVNRTIEKVGFKASFKFVEEEEEDE